MSFDNAVFCLILIVGTMSVQFWTILKAVRSTDHHTEWQILAFASSIVGISCFAALLLFYHRKRVREQQYILSEIQVDSIFTAPTSLGWIGLTEDWIATSNPVKDVLRLELNDFTNFAWGFPNGKYLKHHPDAHFAIPNVLVKKSTGQHWIFVPSATAPKKALFAFFKRESDMLVWKRILDSILNGQPVTFPEEDKRAMARKAEFGLTIFAGSAYVIAWFAAVLAFVIHNRDFGPVFTAVIGLTGIPTLGNKPEIKLIYRDVRLTIAGFDMKGLGPRDQLVLSGDTLICLTASNVGNTGVEEISLSEISEIKLEDWGEPFLEKDIEKWFRKNVPSKHLVLRLILDRSEDSEREFRMPAAVAEKWYSDLKAMRPPSDLQLHPN